MVFSTINRPSTMSTDADAYFRGYDLVVVEDGCEAFSEEDHQDGLDYLE
jgi:nicotinamidase-related amidase